VLKSRQLPDGTILTPPTIVGIYNLSKGYENFNLVVKDDEGNISSISTIATYTISGSTFTEEAIYIAHNDRTGMKSDFTKTRGSSEMVLKRDFLLSGCPFFYLFFKSLKQQREPKLPFVYSIIIVSDSSD